MFHKKGKGKKGRKTYKGKSRKIISYPDRANHKIMSQSTGILNFGAANLSTPTAFGNGNLLGVVVKNVNNICNFMGAFIFNLNNCPQAFRMSQLWDRYKVNKIKVKVIPLNNVADVTGAGCIPQMRIVHDYDDNSTQPPANPNNIWARRGKTHRLDKPFTFEFIPRVNYNSVNGQLASVPMLIQKAPWTNCTQIDSPLYGVKFGVRDWYCNTTPNNLILRFDITYFVSFKEQQDPNLVQNMADWDLPLVAPIDPEFIDVHGTITDSANVILYVSNSSGDEIPYVAP